MCKHFYYTKLLTLNTTIKIASFWKIEIEIAKATNPISWVIIEINISVL